jgi:predicted transcriptional regulator
VNDTFYKLSQDLCKASGFVNKTTGEVIKLTASSKLIYTYILHRYDFFVLKNGGEYFETHCTIGEACDTDPKTVARAVASFIDGGVLKARFEKPKSGGYSRYYYESIQQNIDLVFGKMKNKKKDSIPEWVAESIDDKYLTDGSYYIEYES